jgi:hypothetical protein
MPVSPSIGGGDREEAMQRKNKVFGAAAVLTAAAAIGAGVMVSSGAMAASSGSPTDANVSMVSVGTNGQAVKCEFPAAELPTSNLVPAPDGATPANVVTGQAIEISGAKVLGSGSGSGTIISSTDGSLPVPGVPVMAGTITANGGAKAIQINPDGSTSDMVVRDGTAKECSDLLQQAKTAATAPGGIVVNGSATVTGGEGTTKSTG